MCLKIIILASLLAISLSGICQNEPGLNKSDLQGRKQGHWIRKYPDSTIMYEGYFKDDHPAGEFKRYYKDTTVIAIGLVIYPW